VLRAGEGETGEDADVGGGDELHRRVRAEEVPELASAIPPRGRPGRVWFSMNRTGSRIVAGRTAATILLLDLPLAVPSRAGRRSGGAADRQRRFLAMRLPRLARDSKRKLSSRPAMW
jgi:hypothetical protein